jgi:hypothetical protein
VWALENPVGRIEKLGGLPPWRLSFDPNHIGDPYTKKTLLWGRFNADLPIAPVEPTEGSKMHSQYGGKSLATKNARSVTPEGFAYAFFMANNAYDHPAMTISNKYDRLDQAQGEDRGGAGVGRAERGRSRPRRRWPRRRPMQFLSRPSRIRPSLRHGRKRTTRPAGNLLASSPRSASSRRCCAKATAHRPS